MQLAKPWLDTKDALARLHGNLGVFQLGNLAGDVIYIGFAGGRSLFGLKGAVSDALKRYDNASAVRYEITTAYHTRYRELLMLHQADHNCLPEHNVNDPALTLGRLSPR